MEISLNIVLDRLSVFQLESHIPYPTDRKICHARLPEDPLEGFAENCIYIARLSQILPLPPEKRANAVFICLRDRIRDQAETEEALKGIIIVNENISFEKFFSYVQDIIYKIGSWYQSALDAIIKNRSLQDIIDLSENVVGNYIQITDSSFKLLGYTRGIECDEEISIAARKYGFHPESTIKKFKKHHRIQAWEKTNEILINQDRSFSKYDLVSKIFRFGNTYFAHAVMVCNQTKLSPGTIDIFKMFMEIIGIFVEKDWQSQNNYHHVYDSFLSDLYEGLLIQKDIIEERARHVGIPISGVFCLSVTSADESGRHPASLIAKEISSSRPNDKIIVMNGRIMILSILNPKNDEEQFRTLRENLETFMDQYNLRCGISTIFHDLLDAPRAIQQAQQALSLSGRTPGQKLLPYVEDAINGLDTRVIAFEDSFFYILLANSAANKDIWRGSIYYRALKQLWDYDEKHNMNNLHLLYVYLISESKPVESGAILHMSRNNVVYRIERIEQMIKMDLKKESVRIKLIISYIMLHLYGFD